MPPVPDPLFGGYVLFGGLVVFASGLRFYQVWIEAMGRQGRNRGQVVFALAMLGWFIWAPSTVWALELNVLGVFLLPPACLIIGLALGCTLAVMMKPRGSADDFGQEVLDDSE